MTAAVATRINDPSAMRPHVNGFTEMTCRDQLSLRLSDPSPLDSSQNVSSQVQGPTVVRRVSMSGVYLRRRLVVCLTALVLTLMLAPVIKTAVAELLGGEKESSGIVEMASPETSMISDFVIVQSGQTLWSIARAIQPTGDLRPLVAKIKQINGGASLSIGQAIYLP
ncbi:MAG: hypothetical protein ACI9BS_001892 [Candidatus Poriferisodalaceae bacterium]|jgi:hypothetical protein|tara:strand:- start:506 stop:1006 length:501 start_codon:yes stop_codon:yes gene_type:complete